MFSLSFSLTFLIFFSISATSSRSCIPFCTVTIPVDVDSGRKLSVHKAFRKNVLCTFNLRPVSTGMFRQANSVTNLHTSTVVHLRVFKLCTDGGANFNYLLRLKVNRFMKKVIIVML